MARQSAKRGSTASALVPAQGLNHKRATLTLKRGRSCSVVAHPAQEEIWFHVLVEHLRCERQPPLSPGRGTARQQRICCTVLRLGSAAPRSETGSHHQRRHQDLRAAESPSCAPEQGTDRLAGEARTRQPQAAYHVAVAGQRASSKDPKSLSQLPEDAKVQMKHGSN